jgi:siroheme synthase-like protein
MFPLFLNLTGRRVLVVGGGAVGRRKAHALLDARAVVRLVCLEARPPDWTEPRLEWRREIYESHHLDDVCLAVAAATADVNARVVADARARGIWVSSATDPVQGDWVMPGVVRRGDLTLAISTGGRVPALTRALRERLEQEYDAVFGEWLALLAEARDLLRERIADADRRRAVLEGLCDFAWLDRLRREGLAAVRQALREAIDRAGR